MMNKTKILKPLIFYVVLFAFIVGVTTVAVNYDFDFWARLIAGMGFIQTGHVLKYDFLSYTPTHLWFDHEWGSGVIFYLVQHYLSVVGIFFLQIGLVFSIFFTITRIVNMRSVKTTTAYNFLFYFFAYHAISVIIDQPVRCQLFSFLLFTIFLYILELSRNGKNKPLILLPFLMIIWNNLHGGCVSGIGLICLYAMGEFLNKKPFKKYLYTLIPTALVLIINPWGLSYIKFLLMATTMKRPDVVEWWGLYSVKGFYKFKIFLAFMILMEIFTVRKNISYKKMDKTKFLVLAATFYIAVAHTKLLPFFGIAASCFIYDDFYTLYNGAMGKVKSLLRLPADSFTEAHLQRKTICIYLLVLISTAFSLYAEGIHPLFGTNTYALREIEFIKLNKLKGNLFINFGQGSYAAYKLYPDVKIFMDGRYEEVYPTNYVTIMKNFYLGINNWQYLLEKFPPNILIIENTYPVYNVLSKDKKNWQLAFHGIRFGVFVSTKIAKKHYLQPSSDIHYYRNHAFDTNITFKKSS